MSYIFNNIMDAAEDGVKVLGNLFIAFIVTPIIMPLAILGYISRLFKRKENPRP